jgi:hypothetical protein
MREQLPQGASISHAMPRNQGTPHYLSASCPSPDIPLAGPPYAVLMLSPIGPPNSGIPSFPLSSALQYPLSKSRASE